MSLPRLNPYPNQPQSRSIDWMRLLRMLRRRRYRGHRLNIRAYRIGFGPGFLPTLRTLHFWSPNKTRRSHRIRVWFWWGITILIALSTVWILIESVQALSLFH